MTKFRATHLVGLSMVIAMLTVLLMAFTVGAHTVPVTYHDAQVPPCNTVPQTNIVTSKKTRRAVYQPSHINDKVSTRLSFCINNKTTSSQDVTYQGQVLVTIPTGQSAGILCERPNTARFGLASNPKAVLHIVCK